MFVIVESSDLKRAFSDMSALSCETVSFTTQNRKLIITAGSSVLYEDTIDIKESADYVDTVLNVQYVNVFELLGERGDVHVAFTQFSVDIKYNNMSISLTASDSIVQRPDQDSGDKVLISDKDSLQSALSIFKGLGIFQKTLQMERPLQLYDTYGVIQFPTIWVRVRSSGFTGILTKEQAFIITKFQPTHISVTDVISLYRDNARLVLPASTVPEDDEFMQMLGTMHSYGAKETKGLLARVKKLSSTLGVCDCSVYVGSKTLHFAITKNTVQIVDKADENIEYSFDTRLEYMVAILSMIGSDNKLEFLANDDSVVCIRNENVSVILSTGR